MLLSNGLERAFIGMTIPHNTKEETAIYDYAICIDILMQKFNMNREDATDYFYFKVVTSEVNAPLFIRRATIDEQV